MSVVWDYFQMNPMSNMVVCNVCEDEIPYNSGSTKNMWDHLKHVHQGFFFVCKDYVYESVKSQHAPHRGNVGVYSSPQHNIQQQQQIYYVLPGGDDDGNGGEQAQQKQFGGASSVGDDESHQHQSSFSGGGVGGSSNPPIRFANENYGETVVVVGNNNNTVEVEEDEEEASEINQEEVEVTEQHLLLATEDGGDEEEEKDEDKHIDVVMKEEVESEIMSMMPTQNGTGGEEKRQSSLVWRFYRSIPGECRVLCLLCNQSLSHKYHSTKGMWNHLNLHPEALEELGRSPRLHDRKARISNVSGSVKVKRKRELTDGDFYDMPDESSYTGPPVVKLSRTETFSAAHCLNNPYLTETSNTVVYGKCNNANGHGHNYRWTVVLKGPVDDATGMVYNMQDLKREMDEVIETVDHKHLDKDVPHFRDNGIVSTTENLAIYLYNELAVRMSNPEVLKKVTVDETEKNSFSYAGEFLVTNVPPAAVTRHRASSMLMPAINSPYGQQHNNSYGVNDGLMMNKSNNAGGLGILGVAVANVVKSSAGGGAGTSAAQKLKMNPMRNGNNGASAAAKATPKPALPEGQKRGRGRPRLDRSANASFKREVDDAPSK